MRKLVPPRVVARATALVCLSLAALSVLLVVGYIALAVVMLTGCRGADGVMQECTTCDELCAQHPRGALRHGCECDDERDDDE